MRTLFCGKSRPKIVAFFISVVLLCYANGAIADVTSPVVTSVTVPDNAIYSVGESLDFTVNFNETVFVKPGRSPRLLLVIGGALRYAEYLSGSGSTALKFSYVVMAGEQSLNGIAIVSIIILNGSAIQDAAGNDAVISLNGVGSLASVIVDTASPSLLLNTGYGVNEGQSGAIVSGTQLFASDNYSGAENVIYSIVSAPINGVLRRNGVVIGAAGSFTQSDISANRIAYDHNGSETLSDRFTFTLVDQGGNRNNNNGNNFAFNIVVAAVNDTPIAEGDTASTLESTTVTIDVLANDSDADIGDLLDVASLQLVSAPTHGAATVNSGKIEYTPSSGYVGADTFTYTVNDSSGAKSNIATVTISVISAVDTDGDKVSDVQEALDGTDPNNPDDYFDNTPPVVSVPAEITIDAVGLFTPVSKALLLGVAESTPQAQIESMIALLASDNIDGTSCCNTALPALIDERILLPPGRNAVIWRARDRKGNTTSISQFVNVRPLVSVPKAQVTVEGAVAEVRFILNGRAPFYPLEVPYLIDESSTADIDDHDLIAGIATFNQGETEAVVAVNIAIDNVSEGDEVLIVKIDDRAINTANTQHRITIVEGNVAPRIELVAQQMGRDTNQVARSDGLVTVVARVSDLNSGDTLSFDWSLSDNVLADSDGNLSDLTLVFDPSNLDVGRYTAVLVATDSQGATDTERVHVVLVDALPALSASEDRDGDGINDATEGTADSDGDGIPDYLDNIAAPNVLPASATMTTAFLMECDADVSCRLGSFSALGASGGAALNQDDIARLNGLSSDDNYQLQGEIYDFEMHQLATPGQQVSVVLPLSMAIPEGGVYRKYKNGAWVTFVENDRNAIYSSQGFKGYCPSPNDPSWQTGLTAGHFCLKLTLEDGGPNDADGDVNAEISDPGAVGVLNAGAPSSASASSLSLQTSGGGGGSVGGALLAILLLLGGVKRQIARTRSMSCLVLISGCLLILFANNSRADAWTNTLNNSFVELEVFAANGSQESSDFSRDMLSASVVTDVTSYDVLRTGYQASLGYTFNPYATLLLSYIDLGDVHVDFDTTTTDSALLQQALNTSYPLTGDGLAVAYRYQHRFSPSVSVFADAGLFIWSGDSNTEGATASPDIDGGTDPMVAFGVDYSILKRTSVGLKYRYHRIDNQDLNGLGVLVRVNF